MLKKIYQKDGIIMIFNDNQTIDECNFVINNYHKGECGKDRKSYYIKKGFTYPQIN